MTEKTKHKKMKLQARMFDMGQQPRERVVNRVLHKVGADQGEPSDERLHELLADEHTHEDIQDIYA